MRSSSSLGAEPQPRVVPRREHGAAPRRPDGRAAATRAAAPGGSSGRGGRRGTCRGRRRRTRAAVCAARSTRASSSVGSSTACSTPEQVADLARAVDERRRLCPVRDARGVERVLELAERRAGRQQDRRCRRAGTAPTRRRRRVLDATRTSLRSSAVVTAAATSAASRSRSASARSPCSCASAPSSTMAGPAGAFGRVGIERDVLGLRVGVGDDQLAEHVVHEVDHRRVVRKLRVRCRGAAPNAERARQERGDVGAAEPVDRLLGVADDEQAARVDRRSRPTAGHARRGRPMRGARRGRTGSGSVSWNSSSSRCV